MRFIDADKLIEKITQNCPFKIDTNYESVWGIPIIEAIPIEWIKNYASHKASKDLIDCYWHFWEDDVLKMVADWEKENADNS